MRKVIKVEQKKDQIEEENQTLREEKRSLETRVMDLQAKIAYDSMKRRSTSAGIRMEDFLETRGGTDRRYYGKGTISIDETLCHTAKA
jgi:hypothetical protein